MNFTWNSNGVNLSCYHITVRLYALLPFEMQIYFMTPNEARAIDNE